MAYFKVSSGLKVFLWDRGQIPKTSFTKPKARPPQDQDNPLVIYPSEENSAFLCVRRGSNCHWLRKDNL